MRAMWRTYVESALPYEWVWTVGEFAAAGEGA
jgi:hypothetical protein